MSKIHVYSALAASISAEAKDTPDNVQNELHMAAWHLRKAIHLTRARSQADLEIKIGLWTELIDDPECILLEHRDYWKSFMEDFELLRSVILTVAA